MKSFLIRGFCTTIAFAVAVKLTSMRAEHATALICTALLLVIINSVLRPIIVVLSVPFILVTLGFFILVINALMLMLAGAIVPGFEVGGFWSAFRGSIVISIVNWALSAFFKDRDGDYHVLTHHTQLRPAGEKQIEGKVIE